MLLPPSFDGSMFGYCLARCDSEVKGEIRICYLAVSRHRWACLVSHLCCEFDPHPASPYPGREAELNRKDFSMAGEFGESVQREGAFGA